MFFSHAPVNESVECGSVFRVAYGMMEEKAEVLSVSNDPAGIPHVRFYLEVKHGCGAPCFEQRTLALESFRTRYRERL